MLIPCEVAVKSVIPALRALVAKELTQKYKDEMRDIMKNFPRDKKGRWVK